MSLAPPSVPQSHAGALLSIDLAALVENWRALKARARGDACDMGAVVKADAYGLGVGPVAQALAAAGCKTFYVAHLDEGIGLRAHLGPGPTIVVMHGPNKGTEKEFVAHHLIPVLNTRSQIAGWKAFTASADVLRECIVQVDTGMNRLGLTAREFSEAMTDPEIFAGLYPLALMSHLACADVEGHPMNQLQRERFASDFATFRTKFPVAKGSLANSAGVFLGSAFRYDLARPGMALYGVNPVAPKPNPMIQVARLMAQIVQVRRVDQASPVGYGATFLARDGAKLATASIGYADGVLRSWGGRGAGFMGDIKVPVAGPVSMDLIVFDVSNVPDSELFPGALIEIMGSHQSVDDVAAAAGTIGYEILTGLGPRYHRHYLPARR